MPHDFLIDGPDDADITIILAHGAGGAMDTPWMEQMSKSLGERRLKVVRFEFGYMAARRTSAKRAPPPRAELLTEEFKAVVAEISPGTPCIIGGKSMGGRVASLIADPLYEAGKIRGLLCLGYPFHPIGKPENLRTSHLEHLRTPTLICQGTRDLFGTKEEVAGYALSDTIEILWLEDGDHDLRPRKAVSGHSFNEHIATVAEHVAAWARRL